MESPDVRSVRALVQLVPDQQLEARLPRREATVTVVLADGTQLTEHVDAVRGTAENPMPRAEVVAKCRDLMSPILGRAHCEDLIDQVLALETVTNVQGLRPCCSAPSSHCDHSSGLTWPERHTGCPAGGKP
jgi:2-methylcitrate dehydratase PrpD